MTSYHVFFAFSSGLAKPLRVPAGTLRRCQEHVTSLEQALGLEVVKYGESPERWDTRRIGEGVPDETFCRRVSWHNSWVRYFYEQLAAWSKEPPLGLLEKLTPEGAATFWRGLQLLEVPIERWTRDYYRERMEHLYSVMRGVESEGVALGEKPLSTRQAAAVIRLFSHYLDDHDLRLDVPKGHDRLASSYYGEYDWCEKCGPMDPDEGECCRKRRCPLFERRLVSYGSVSAAVIAEMENVSASTVRRRLRVLERESRARLERSK